VNIPDTVGYSIPDEYGRIIRTIIDRVPNIGKAIVSVHCHDDLGLAVANSLSGVLNGARQVECTINELVSGQVTPSLEEIAMAIRTRHETMGVETNINTEKFLNRAACSRR